LFTNITQELCEGKSLKNRSTKDVIFKRINIRVCRGLKDFTLNQGSTEQSNKRGSNRLVGLSNQKSKPDQKRIMRDKSPFCFVIFPNGIVPTSTQLPELPQASIFELLSDKCVAFSIGDSLITTSWSVF